MYHLALPVCFRRLCIVSWDQEIDLDQVHKAAACAVFENKPQTIRCFEPFVGLYCLRHCVKTKTSLIIERKFYATRNKYYKFDKLSSTSVETCIDGRRSIFS
jgi:hypothetical protein